MSYGNIMEIKIKYGSSQKSRSESYAKYDAGEMEKYRSIITRVGRNHGIDPALIAGIISRESSAGVTLKGGLGDDGKAWGLMQVDISPTGGNHPKIGGWNSEEHLDHATGILVEFIKIMQDKNNGWNREQQLKAGIAAYNAGPYRVPDGHNVDVNTTGGDYSDDVVARAQWYKTNKGY